MAKSIYIYCSEHGPFDGNSCKLCEDKPENQIARLRAALAEVQAALWDKLGAWLAEDYLDAAIDAAIAREGENG